MGQTDDLVRPGTVRNFVGYGRVGPRVHWPNGARLALNFAINYEEGSEKSFLDGDGANEGVGDIAYGMTGPYRDLSTESGYEYGSRAGIWRTLRLFDEYGLKTTFFACGMALERNPEVAQAIVAGHHEPCCHGYRWREPWPLTRDQERAEIRRGVESITALCGERPLGWYSRYGPSVHTRDLLVEEGGFIYDSNAYNDDLPYFVDVAGKRHLVVPYTHVYNDGRFAIAPHYSAPTDFVDNCVRGIRELWREGEQAPKMMSIGLHPRWIGQAGRVGALREVIETALGLGKIWITRRIDIARWWLDHHDEF